MYGSGSIQDLSSLQSDIQALNCSHFGLYIPLLYTMNFIGISFLHLVFFSLVRFTPPTIYTFSRSLLSLYSCFAQYITTFNFWLFWSRPYSFSESLLCINQCPVVIFIWRMCIVLLMNKNQVNIILSHNASPDFCYYFTWTIIFLGGWGGWESEIII